MSLVEFFVLTIYSLLVGLISLAICASCDFLLWIHAEQRHQAEYITVPTKQEKRRLQEVSRATGTRYFRLDIDHEGHVANSDGTEQPVFVAQSTANAFFGDFHAKMSLVQI